MHTKSLRIPSRRVRGRKASRASQQQFAGLTVRYYRHPAAISLAYISLTSDGRRDLGMLSDL